jgi:hypothetical protein
MKAIPCLKPAALVASMLLLAAGPASAARDRFFVELVPAEEVPSVSSGALGTFIATVDDEANTIEYELVYTAMTGEVRQAHIHFGQRGVNGGISVFLCQSTANPDPTNNAPACTAPPARLTGTLRAANIIGPGGQGIAATEMAELINAIRTGLAYVNVHTATFGGGEIRGQFDGRPLGRRGRPEID